MNNHKEMSDSESKNLDVLAGGASEAQPLQAVSPSVTGSAQRIASDEPVTDSSVVPRKGGAEYFLRPFLKGRSIPDHITNVLNLPGFNFPKLKVGIYFLIYKREVVYIGRTRNFVQRILQHIQLGKRFNKVRLFSFNHQDDYVLETELIRRFRPKYNRRKPEMDGLKKYSARFPLQRGKRAFARNEAKLNHAAELKPI